MIPNHRVDGLAPDPEESRRGVERCGGSTSFRVYWPNPQGVVMPKISEFFGIAIYVYWRDHGPPHFHAVYAGEEVAITIEDVRVLSGRLPPRATGLVIEWATLHQEELRKIWRQAENLEPLGVIEPLR